MIRYAQGYRPTKAGTIRGTGLLSANSFPTAAEVYINGKLTTATDNTLNLDPGSYDVEIKKDGYHTWSKKLAITAELVTETNAQLFPTSPSLDPLTYTGALQAIPGPDGTKIAYTVASASAVAKNGLYVQDLTSSPISLNKTARQIARTETGYDYTNCSYTWSPNGSEILVSFAKTSNHILLDTTQFNDLATLKDVTVRLPQILSEWELELARQERVQLMKLPDFMASVATESATNLYFSPDNKRLLYQATAPAEIPSGLVPAVPSSSTQVETRALQTGSWYVYDLKEDKNFLLTEGKLPEPSLIPKVPSLKRSAAKVKESSEPLPFTPSKLTLLPNFQDPIPAELVSSPSAFHVLQNNVTTAESITLLNAQYSPIFVANLQWFPDSSHLILTTDNGIDLVEYDGTNRLTIYGGPMDKNIIYPWPDGSKIITRIAFSEGTVPNLYTIKLK